jgi:hypothetical protein
MNSPFKRFWILIFLGLGLTGVSACGSGDDSLLLFPSIVAIDSANNRVFVVSNQDNGLALIDPVSLTLVGEEALLNADGPFLLPNFPSNAAVASLGRVSRLFIIGVNNASPMNQITVLDYNGIILVPAPFSPIAVSGQAGDTLVGIAVDPANGLVFVSNSTTAQVHAYDISNGAEVVGSPVALGGMPGRLQYDSGLGRIVVSNLTTTQVSYLDPANLAAAPVAIETGILTRDAASVTNASGTVLFVSGNQQNTARVFRVDLTTPANTTQIFEVLPPAPTGPPPAGNLLTGTLNQVRADILTDGRVGGYFTQSSGDLLALDLSSNLNTLTPALVTIGAVSGEGIDLLQNGGGQATAVYFASPSVGTVTIVDPQTNLFTDQVN